MEDCMNREGSLNNKVAGMIMAKAKDHGRRELLLDDFRGIDTEGWTGLHYLACISSVALDRFEKEKQHTRRTKQVMTSDLMMEHGKAEKVIREADTKPTTDCLAPKKRVRVVFGGGEAQKSSRGMEKPCKDAIGCGIDLRLGPDGNIPLDVKECIDGMGGENIQLVCEKPLTASDVKKDQHRLMIPQSMILSPSFLHDKERKFLRSRVGIQVNELRVPLVEPTLDTCEVSLRRWVMGKGEGKPCTTYVLAGGWNGVVSRNDLKKGDIVQLWSFRVGSELCLALIAAHNI